MPDEMLPPARVAAELGVTVRTLANWRWLGIGPKYVKLTSGRSGRVRYMRSGVDEWRKAKEAEGTAA